LVLNKAEGVCENCRSKAPFIKETGTPYLEVHHLRHLADGGSDTVSNTIAVCPNCHQEFHYGSNKFKLLNHIYSNVGWLTAE